ncbi:copper transporter, partial [Genlisea aurea]
DPMPGMCPPPSPNNTSGMGGDSHDMEMHMTFFWGKNTLILFDGWPGYDRIGMYILSIIVIFSFALIMELLSFLLSLRRTHSGIRVLQTAAYGLRVGLAYLVMLAIMSFNGGIFLAAVAGHVAGFFI